jgi:hypothetical protein
MDFSRGGKGLEEWNNGALEQWSNQGPINF